MNKTQYLFKKNLFISDSFSRIIVVDLVEILNKIIDNIHIFSCHDNVHDDHDNFLVCLTICLFTVSLQTSLEHDN